MGVYSLTTDNWVRDLVPGEVGEAPSDTKVAGSDLVVAAVMWGMIVTVWSSKKEMERLFCLNVINCPCFGVGCEHNDDIVLETR